MKKYAILFLAVICAICLFGCSAQPSNTYTIAFTVPAGSRDIIWSDELYYFDAGNLTVSAEYEEIGTNVVAVWLSDSSIEHAFEGNPYTNTIVLPNDTSKVAVEAKREYKIGIMVVDNSESDVPVVITIHD